MKSRLVPAVSTAILLALAGGPAAAGDCERFPGYADVARKAPAPEVEFTILPGIELLHGSAEVIVESLAP